MNISLRVSDVGGQSINSRSLQQYLASATLVFLVYDTTNPSSFHDLADWLASVRKHSPNAKLYLIGNKVMHKKILLQSTYLTNFTVYHQLLVPLGRFGVYASNINGAA
jgi:GTPase SAR1 family protein